MQDLLKLPRGAAHKSSLDSASGPSGLAALRLRAQEACKAGDTAAAIALLREGLADSPAHSETWNDLGALLGANGRAAEAEACFKNAFRADPQDFTALENLVEISIRLNKRPEAAALVAQWTRLRPRCAKAWVFWAKLHLLAGNTAGARTALTAAAGIDPRDAAVRNALESLRTVPDFAPPAGVSADAKVPDLGPDPLPGRPRILFVANAESSHTQAWIGLLRDAPLNVRLFGAAPAPSAEAALAQVVRAWRPDVIHTLGLDPAGFLYARARTRFELAGIGAWVLSLWGGSDLELSHLDPARAPGIAEALRPCDRVLSDNEAILRIGEKLGLRKEQIASIAPVPGTGGVDVTALAADWRGKTSARRMILWPKAYECTWSKALPVFEALRLAWRRIQPCQVQMLAMQGEAREWYRTLPEEIRRGCATHPRLPREELLQKMASARVMLAPTLVDGLPNSLLEAMACGAFPIVSPLESIRPILEHGRNALFARNLYPEEIAEALVRAMTDDALVDDAAARNLERVRQIADRPAVRGKVLEFYQQLVREAS